MNDAPDKTLVGWQRELMAELAGQDTLAGGTASQALATGADGTWQQLPPPSARDLHVAVYDPVRDRMVVFGGYARGLVNDVWILQLAGTSEWSRLIPAGTPPSPRNQMSAIYDPVRDRIVLFGGFDQAVGFRDDVWALSLGATPTWSRIVPAGVGPAARGLHSVVYDPVQDRMIVFGGYNWSRLFDDTWALSLSGSPAWSPLSPAGQAPSARYSQSAVYDPVRDRVLVFGGYDGQARLNDVWSLALRGKLRWRPLDPTGTLPTPRVGHASIFDPAGDRMVVFSGLADGYVHDTWALSLHGRDEWIRIVAESGPSVRWGQSAIYDPARKRMVVFGGLADGSRLVSEIWGLSLSAVPTWTNLTTPDTPPGPRWGHSAVFDAAHERMLLFGGYGFNNEVWVLSLAGKRVWTRLRPSGTPPSPREGHAAIYDPLRDRMLVFGGDTGIPGMSNEVWALSISADTAWTRILPTGAAPVPRAEHTAIFDAANDRMVVFGGVSSSAYLSDVWALSLSPQPTWTRVGPVGSLPRARFEHSAIYDPVRKRMVVFGGLSSSLSAFGDVWALSLDGTPAWTQITPTGAKPAARAEHRAIWDSKRDRMVVTGGFNYLGGPRPGPETWALALDPPEWVQLAPAGDSPGSMVLHSAVYDPRGDRMLVFGASGSNDLWELQWDSPAAPLAALAHGLPRRDESNPAPPQVSPNPSRGEVTISFSLAQTGEASVRIFDVAGRSVVTLASGILPAGPHTIRWNGVTTGSVPAKPGFYFCEVRAYGSTSVQRFMLIP